jgi:hypothetical protein
MATEFPATGVLALLSAPKMKVLIDSVAPAVHGVSTTLTGYLFELERMAAV